MIGFPDTTGTFHTELLKLFVCTQLDSLRGLITLESLVVMCLVVSYIIRLRLAAICILPTKLTLDFDQASEYLTF